MALFSAPLTVERVAALAAQLAPADRLRLVEQIVHDLVSPPDETEATRGYDWMSIRGIAPNLLGGQDAQEWVSHTRREGDEHREKQWRAET